MSKYKYEKQFMFSQKKPDEVRWFLKEKQNLDISLIKDDKQNTVLHQYAYQGSLVILRLYLQFMTNFWRNQLKSPAQVEKQKVKWINLQNKQGYSCMHYAAYKGFIDIIDQLKQLGGDFTIRTNAGLKIFHLASQCDKVKTFIYFRGVLDINQPDEKGSTPLHWAAYSGSQKVTEYLLCQRSKKISKLNINVNAQDIDLQTPLHLATANGNTKIVRKLLIAGANRHIKNKQKLQPIDIAKQNQFFSIQHFLNDKYNWLDYIKFFLNIKMKYVPKSRSMTMPIVFILTSVCLVALITLGIKYRPEYITIFYTQQATFLALLLLYMSLIVEPNRLKRGKYSSIILKNLKKQSQYSDGTIVSNNNSSLSMINLSTQIQSICLRCVQYKPVRAYHCDICNICIEQYDHHCPWINNCVGKNNIKRFIMFLVVLFVVMNWILVITIQFILVIINDPGDQVAFFQIQDWVSSNPIILYAYVCITLFLYLFFVFPLLFLIFVQIYNLLLGKTTYERFSKANQSILSRSQKEFIGNNSGQVVKGKEQLSCGNCMKMCYQGGEEHQRLLE